MEQEPSSAVRSYVRRTGRMTRAQRKALQEYWPLYGVQCDRVLSFDALFGRVAPCFLEVGFGMGDALVEMAQASPQRDFLGIEVHTPGVGRLLARLAELDLRNVRVIQEDACTVLNDVIPAGSLQGVYVFFPDPWPKKRHHKRRLIQAPFVELLARRLVPGGCLSLATDWEHYALAMLAVVEASRDFRNLAGPGQFSARPPDRPMTKFERRGVRLGHAVWDLAFERVC